MRSAESLCQQATLSNPLNEKNLTSLEELYNVRL